MDYSELSYYLTKKLNKDDKKNNGIYFTHPETIDKNLILLENYINYDNKKINILEPSCGSCEYIEKINKKYNNVKITGIEYNKIIFDSIKNINNDNVKIYRYDYLKYKSTVKYDLIIGNPPYYVMKKKDVEESYFNYFEGRPNIFILFIIKSLHLLNDKGILSFILPKNFLNCTYYDKTRIHIYNNFEILKIIDCDNNFIETKQETIIIILRKTDKKYENDIFCLNRIKKYLILGNPENILKIKQLYENYTTLEKMGFKVSVGSIVWNQYKNILTNDNNKTVLIYSSDIKNNRLELKKYKNEYKKNYIDKKGKKDLLLIINRGYGKGKYNFEYCLIDEDFEYLIENHLICITYNQEIDREELKKKYYKIINSFNNKKTKNFIELYFGNNSINTKELCEILPIYDI